MKILVISQYYRPENFRINDISDFFVHEGHDVSVWTGIPNYPQGKYFPSYGLFSKRKEIMNGIKIIRHFTIPRGKNKLMLMLNYLSFMVSSSVHAVFTRTKPDIVYIFGLSPVFQGYAASILKRKLHIPVFHYVLDLWPNSFTAITGKSSGFAYRIAQSLSKKIYGDASLIVVTSPGFIDQIGELTSRKIETMFLPQYFEDFYQPYDINNLPHDFPLKEKQGIRFIYTGNIGKAQDLLTVVNAFLSYNQATNATDELVIVGDGSDKDALESVINTHPKAKQVVLLQSVKPTEVPQYLAVSDIAILPLRDSSVSDTIPGKFQTYLACGIPILSIGSGVTSQLVRDINCGMSVTFDINKIKYVFEEIANMSKSTLKQWSENAWKYAQDNYSRNVILNSTIKKMESIVSEGTHV